MEQSLGNFYDTTPSKNRIVLTTVITKDDIGMKLIDELPSGDDGEPAIRVYKKPNGDKLVMVLTEEPFTLSTSVAEWLKECLNG
jgi:hypothetical protein